MALTLIPALVGEAWGKWSMNRHDPARTGTSEMGSDLERPVVSWRYYLGGTVSADGMLAADVNDDGRVEVVYLTGGRVVAKRPFDALVWESAPMNLKRIEGVMDLDGDGVLDIVASGAPGLVVIIRGTDGQLQWRTDPATLGPSIGAVRIADLDDDGRADDLYVPDRAHGVTGNKGDTAFGFSFQDGFAPGYDDGTSQRLWQLEQGREYNSGLRDVVADITGDGKPDIVAFATTYMYLFDGLTGKKVASGDTAGKAQDGYPIGFPIPYGTVTTDLADVDGDGRLEIIAYSNNGYKPSMNSRAVFVVDYDASEPEGSRLKVLWARHAAELTTDTHLFVSEGAADLDGDGVAEVVSSFREGGVWSTYVFDGATGIPKATIAGAYVRAVYPPLEASTRPMLLVQRGAVAEAYRFDTWDGTPAPKFTFTAATVVRSHDQDRARGASAATVPLTVPLGEGRLGFVLRRGNRIELWEAPSDEPRERATHLLPDDVSAVSFAPQRDTAVPGSGLLVSRSDGYLAVLDAELKAVNFWIADPGTEFQETAKGLRTGGYHWGSRGMTHTAAATTFAGSGEHLVVRDSRRVLLRLDPAGASVTRPPAVLWQWPGVYYPALVDVDGDGKDDVVTRASTFVHARQADGVTPIFDARVTSGKKALFADVVPVRTEDGSLQLAVGSRDSGTGEGMAHLLDARGNLLWETQPIVTAGSGQGSICSSDINGDGHEDLLVNMRALLRLYDGTSGALLASSELNNHANMPIAVQGRAGEVTHIGGAAYRSSAGWHIDLTGPTNLTPVWQLRADFHSSRQHGTVVTCASGRLRFAEGRYESAELVLIDAATGDHRQAAWLAGGKLFVDEAAMRQAKGVWPGSVGNVTGTTRLFGEQPAFLVGSTDGYLYAVDPCSESPRLLWALNLRSPVGEPILADTDGDEQAEIIVSAANGYLYALDTEQVPAPESVIDLDPVSGGSDEDVDETHGPALVAQWTAVESATSYEYAVFTAGGTPVSRNPADEKNPFIATTGTQGSWDKQLSRGVRYYFAVRAIGSAGSSTEVLSDGTRWLNDFTVRTDGGAGDAEADAGAGDSGQPVTGNTARGGCGCRAADGRPSTAGLLFVLVGLLGTIAHRRRRDYRAPHYLRLPGTNEDPRHKARLS